MVDLVPITRVSRVQLGRTTRMRVGYDAFDPENIWNFTYASQRHKRVAYGVRPHRPLHLRDTCRYPRSTVYTGQ